MIIYVKDSNGKTLTSIKIKKSDNTTVLYKKIKDKLDIKFNIRLIKVGIRAGPIFEENEISKYEFKNDDTVAIYSSAYSNICDALSKETIIKIKKNKIKKNKISNEEKYEVKQNEKDLAIVI